MITPLQSLAYDISLNAHRMTTKQVLNKIQEYLDEQYPSHTHKWEVYNQGSVLQFKMCKKCHIRKDGL